jgi:hypothetical protein
VRKGRGKASVIITSAIQLGAPERGTDLIQLDQYHECYYGLSGAKGSVAPCMVPRECQIAISTVVVWVIHEALQNVTG